MTFFSGLPGHAYQDDQDHCPEMTMEVGMSMWRLELQIVCREYGWFLFIPGLVNIPKNLRKITMFNGKTLIIGGLKDT
jgi:hypothetical protein